MSKAQAIPRYEDLYGSQFVSPEDFPEGKRAKVKIQSFEVSELAVYKGRGVVKNKKVVLTCEGCKKKIAVNKTSAKRLASAWGKDFAAWPGHYIFVEGGEVNGKAATLLTPVRDNPPAATVTTPQETGDETLHDDDLSNIDESAIPN